MVVLEAFTPFGSRIWLKKTKREGPFLPFFLANLRKNTIKNSKAMLKIYKHLKAQAQIKVKMGVNKDKEPIVRLIKFVNGRTRGTGEGVLGGSFHTEDEKLQKAIEARSDFGKNFFIDHKIEAEKKPLPEEDDYKIFPGIDSINRVKNKLKEEFGDKAKGEALRDTEEILKFCKRMGVAFPDFFTVDQGHFAKKLEEKADAKADAETKETIAPAAKEVATEEVKTPTDEVETEEQEVTVEDLMAMSRKDLDEAAAGHGVEEPESLENKQAVVDAILKQ